MATRSKSAAAVAAAFLKPSVKRIKKGSTCTILGITNESIRCAGCTNAEEKCLLSRVKSASIDSRWYKCGKPWVLKGKTDHFVRIYENTWKELVDVLGYPPSCRLPDSSNSSKIRKGPPPSFEVSKRKKQKAMTPASDLDVGASNQSCSQHSNVSWVIIWGAIIISVPSNRTNHHRLWGRHHIQHNSFNIVAIIWSDTIRRYLLKGPFALKLITCAKCKAWMYRSRSFFRK